MGAARKITSIRVHFRAFPGVSIAVLVIWALRTTIPNDVGRASQARRTAPNYDSYYSSSNSTNSSSSSSSNSANSSSDTVKDDLLVDYGDSIYHVGEWDGAPIVLEPFQLLFFTSPKVGCTIWKQLFRRMNGAVDYRAENTAQLLPWNPVANGLRYLYQYDRATANHMMTHPNWTRALIVREPKERFVSAYLDKAFQHPTFLQEQCCRHYAGGVCAHNQAQQQQQQQQQPKPVSPEAFVRVMQTCNNPHWRPQSKRMEAKYWPYINFIGHMETVADSAEQLLRQIGAWEEFGASGWGVAGDEAIFQAKAGGAGRTHATGAATKLRLHISAELEKELDEFYRHDYASPFLNLTRIQLY
jgi:hypothetical protein